MAEEEKVPLDSSGGTQAESGLFLQKSKRKSFNDSLTLKMVLRLIRGVAAGIFIFLLLYYGCTPILDESLQFSTGFYTSELDRVGELQDFVREKRIAATDTSALYEWGNSRNILGFQIKRNGSLLFDISYPEGAAFSLIPHNGQMQLPFIITFEDGDADVYLYEGYGQQYYRFLLASSILLGIAVCLAVFASEMQTDIDYILLLEKEVRSISQGILEKEVTVKGSDELAMLAFGLNQMRLQLIDQKQKEQEMRQTQDRLVVGMSHDMRTPLTGLIAYMEILRKQDQSEFNRKYLDKAYEKVLQIRTMMDQTFEFFLVYSGEETALEEPETFESIFEDYLSELFARMECSGFTVQAGEVEWKPVLIRVKPDYPGRIMNNIASNLEKYADRNAPLHIRTLYTEDYACISIENGTGQKSPESRGTGIGMKNIARMMEQMNGKLQVRTEENTYEVTLFFPIWKQENLS